MPPVDWRTEWFELDDVAYLNIAGQSPLPRAAIRAAQAAIEWKKYPHKMPEDVYFALPGRVREKLAALIGAAPDEIALTTGASAGLAAVANGYDWKPEDEVLIAAGEFPGAFRHLAPDAGSWTAACASGATSRTLHHHRRPDPGDHAAHDG